MKRTFLTIFLLITAISLFAATPNATFEVSASIAGINDMKITNTAVDVPTYNNPNNAFEGTVAISTSGEGSNMDSSGNVAFSAYISTLSNNRSGYSVLMSATALTHEDDDTTTINYTVTVNDTSFATKTDTTAVEVIDVTSLSGLDTESLPISVNVVRSEYDSAVAGTYVGTITFEYIGNN
ncbi:MAG: hypothetical protein WC233_01185 [Sphaerochaeta sp.]